MQQMATVAQRQRSARMAVHADAQPLPEPAPRPAPPCNGSRSKTCKTALRAMRHQRTKPLTWSAACSACLLISAPCCCWSRSKTSAMRKPRVSWAFHRAPSCRVCHAPVAACACSWTRPLLQPRLHRNPRPRLCHCFIDSNETGLFHGSVHPLSRRNGLRSCMACTGGWQAVVHRSRDLAAASGGRCGGPCHGCTVAGTARAFARSAP